MTSWVLPEAERGSKDVSQTVTKEQLGKLRPFLGGAKPDPDTGEVDMFCPLHNDGKRSCSLNVERGVWFCHAGCGGGRVQQLIDAEDTWISPEGRVSNGSPSGRSNGTVEETITMGHVEGWHRALLDNKQLRDDLFDARGIDITTIEKHKLGYDLSRKAYTIPVFGKGQKIYNVRRYDIAPSGGRRKIWSVKGMGAPRLYTEADARALRPGDSVIICEGEWDKLLTEQNGFKAITRTGAAKVWKENWSRYFRGCVVYLCHDCDVTGMEGNRIVYEALREIADEIRFLRLPYPIVEKHGKDLTDFWLDNEDHGSAELMALMDDAQLWDPARHEPEDLAPDDASVMDTFDSRRVGDPVRVTVTIKGKRDPGYSVPRKVEYRCTQDAGSKCQVCPMRAANGAMDREIAPGDPVILDMVDAGKIAVREALRETADIQKCNRLRVEVAQHQAVEVLFARPSVEHVRGSDAADYKNMKIMSAGRHDTLPNNTVQVTGALWPSPRTQGNEFLAWDVQRMETSLDSFILDGKAIQQMRKFQAREGERPMKKLGAISRALATHVTKIYGRPEMHAAMDLVFHSVLAFDFAGQRIDRGWLELLVEGDTRTGKSEVASQLARYYSAGEVISCEAATYAGIVGGLQQYGSSKEWAVTWGAIPINDRRLVVLDEVGGLHPEEIAQLSSVRSSGTAELTKIQSERTFARTRLIWLGNPRNGRMSDFTYGVQAIRPLIGNDEDIARFDFAMAVVADEVPSEVINSYHRSGKMIYDEEACAALVRWAWSRRPEHIVWVDDAEERCLTLAQEMGKRYIESPPLVQGANIRVKIARLAVAMAARLFSTDDEFERVLVRTEHVEDAVSFLDRIYGMRSFGYAERSKEIIADRLYAADRALEMERYLEASPALAKFLRGSGRFRRPDLEEIMNISREEANAIIQALWDARMIRKDRGDIKVEPELHNILREVNV
jgi:hypothetical protein